jgi:hypothetical protein
VRGIDGLNQRDRRASSLQARLHRRPLAAAPAAVDHLGELGVRGFDLLGVGASDDQDLEAGLLRARGDLPQERRTAYREQGLGAAHAAALAGSEDDEHLARHRGSK